MVKILKINFARLVLILIFFLLVSPAIAADTSCGKTFCLNVPIGKNLQGFDINAAAGVSGNAILGEYIAMWYGFLLGTIGILATVVIMWNGFKYLTSRGDSTVISAAKTNIISAITGVVLAFAMYSLLNLVNPQLLSIEMPNLPGIKGGDNVTLQVGADEATVNSASSSGGGTAYGGGTNGFGAGLPGLPAPGGSNIPASTRQIETDISKATGYNPTNDIRPNSTGSYHVNGSAVDYPKNPVTDSYFNTLVNGVTPVVDPKWGPIYTLTNAKIGDTTYPKIRIIKESTCWHIDQGRIL